MQISKRFRFEAAHRLLNSYTKRCQGIHGHSYEVEVFIEGEMMPTNGMVMDFTLLKEKVMSVLDNFDHSLIVDIDDLELKELAPKLNNRYLVLNFPPTAENLARYFFMELHYLIPASLKLSAIRIDETANSSAVYKKEDYDKDIGSILFLKARFLDTTKNK